MKEVALSKVKDDLSRYLRLAEKEEIVITRHGKPAGVLVAFRTEDDWFDYRLESDPRFLGRIEAARRSLSAGRGVRLEVLQGTRCFRLGCSLSAAIARAPIGPRPVTAQGQPRTRRIDPFERQLADHLHKARMIANHVRPHHIDAQLLAKPADFHVKIVDNLHRFRQEADRHNDHVSRLA
jgi:prevent-host-death family protein